MLSRLFSFLICLCPVFSWANGLQLADAFGDAMVLQRDAAVPVWGTAAPGATVTVSFGGQSKAARADNTGQWQLALDPLRASAENRVFTVKSGGDTVALKDVLVGEVWFCSGQSNMELGLAAAEGGRAAMQKADHPQIRLRYSNRITAATPQTKIDGSPWMVCTPETIARGLNSNSFSAVGYFFGRRVHEELKVPVGLILAAWGSTHIEPWTAREGFLQVPGLQKIAEKPLPAKLDRKTTPMVDFNAMVHPFIPYAIRGVIWYQGESNVGDRNYDEKMRALIQGWRTLWKQGDFPFYFVQLAPYFYGKSTPPEALPLMWEQQAAALALPNTGMAMTSDVSNRYNIHPPKKEPVGERLARLALSRVYGVKFRDDSGPIFKTARVEGSKIVVEFNHAESELATRDEKPVSHFEIAGTDGKFLQAEVRIAGKTVVVSHPQITTPVQVRFAWDQGALPNLMNGEKLPALAFRWPVPDPR